MKDSIILVTGSNGLVGRNLIDKLRIDNKIYGLVHSDPQVPIDGIEYVKIDFTEKDFTKDLPSDPDTIIHLAQSSRYREFPNEALDVFKVNIASTAHLLDYARMIGVRQFVYTSSGGVYGTGRDAFHENSPISDHGKLGYYLGSKFCSEILAENYSTLFNVIILGLFFVYGPRQKQTMLIPRLINNIKSEHPIILQGRNGIYINPIHVDDTVDIISNILSLNESHTLNVGGSEILSLRSICDIIGDSLGKKPNYQYDNKPSSNLIANVEKLEHMIDFHRIPFAQGILDLI